MSAEDAKGGTPFERRGRERDRESVSLTDAHGPDSGSVCHHNSDVHSLSSIQSSVRSKTQQ